MKGSLAIITARGGSKRIPRKNIRDFLGKPIMAYAIAAALESGCFEEVMVSSEDEEIASLAESLGAQVPFLRSKESSDDFATTAQVLSEVFERYRSLGREFGHACCLYPTAPFVTAEKLRRGQKLLLESGADSVVPVVGFGYPVQRALEIKDGRLGMIWPQYLESRSQDLPPAYHDSGQFYFFRVGRFLETGKLFGEHTRAMVLPPTEVQDIDSEDDWQLAEMKYRILQQTGEQRGSL